MSAGDGRCAGRHRQLREMYPGGEERRERQSFVDRDSYTYVVPR